ncbi:MAG: hypothetical protein L0H84_14415, partial [Pseudonocardia sp.]|nr:hypothetical protein [Pseudonocardia sp.]
MSVAVELSEELVDLGAALGIVTVTNGSAGVNEDWFADPGRYLGDVFAERAQREALLRLAARGLGNPVADLDLPDVPDTQQWVPLAATPAGGLFLVATEDGDGAVLGLGARVGTAAAPALAATVHVPLVRVGGAASGFVVGTAAGTIELAASVELAGGPAPGGIGVDRAALALTVPTDGAPPRFRVALTGLRVDGAPARDVLVDSGEPAGALLDTALVVLRALVLDAAADGPLAHLLALLGIGGDAALPVLPLAEVVAEGAAPALGWLRGLATDSAAVRAWVGHLAGLLGLDPLTALSGDGSTGAPLAVTMDVGAAGMAFTLVLGADAATGDPVLRPGLRVRLPAPAGVPGRVEALVELAEVTVGAGLKARPLPAARAVAHLGPDLPLGAGADPLVDTTIPGGTAITVGALDAGVGLDGDARPVLVLAALDVTIGADHYPVVDLTMPDAVLQVAAGALDDVVTGLLATLGGSEAATAVLALLGLRRPGSLDAAAPWPRGVDLPAFFAQPLPAVAGFHAAVLADGDWHALALELAVLLRGGTTATVSGAGTEADPWTIPVTTDLVGTAALTAWAAGTALHIGLALRPTPVALAAGTELAPVVAVELLDVDPTATAATALPAVEVALALAGDLALDLGTVGLEIAGVSAALRWRRGSGLAVRVGVVDAVAEVSGTRVPLPIPGYDSTAGLPALPADFPWPVLTRLLGDALLTRGIDWLAGLATLTRWDRVLPTVVTTPPGVPAGLLPGLP